MNEPDRGAAVTLSTEDVLAAIGAEILQIANSGKPKYIEGEVDIATGQPTLSYSPEGLRFNQLVEQRKAILDGVKGGGEALSPNTAAQVGATLRGQDIAADTANKNREQQGERDLETIRSNNLKTTLDLLEQDVKRGELSANEATNRITAATQSANVQRNVMADFGKYALPAGQQYFPSGPLAALATSMGLPAPQFETGGTFGLNPSALGDSITGAVGQSAMPGVDSALANAAKMLSGLGIQIPPTLDGRAMRAPSQGVTA